MKPEKLSKYIEIANREGFEKAFEQAFKDGRDSLALDVNRELKAYQDHMEFVTRVRRENA